MAFHEIRLPMDIAWGYEFGPEYKTSITELPSGDEVRVSHWSKGRKKWTINKEDLTRADIVALEKFFRGRKGRLYGFRHRDWNSYKVTDEPLPLVTNTTAQLQFVYTDSVNPEIQKVTKPVLSANVNNDPTSPLYSPDITLKRNGVAWASAGNWTLDRTTGLITYNVSQAGQTITWSGSYDWPVRFNSDFAGFKRESLDIHDWSGIELIELKQ